MPVAGNDDKPIRNVTNGIGQLRDLRWRPVMTGLLSFLPGVFAWWDSRRPMGNTASATYCRGIWQFHCSNSVAVSGRSPRAIGELGPGATLGTCIAALLDGVDKAVALDAGRYASTRENLRLLHELSGGVPTRRMLRIVENAENPDTDLGLTYAAPWTDPTVCDPESLDLIFSHSVMEHVVDPAAAYRACHRWLRPDGVVSHKIDHSSHGITRSWNGHYQIPDSVWAIIFGKRPYLLNCRRPLQHLEDLRAAGFVIHPESRFAIDDVGRREVLLEELPEVDLVVRTSTILATKATN